MTTHMQAPLHQARFGQDDRGGFAMLDTTYPDTDSIKALSPSANLIESPPDYLHWQPSLRGFPWKEFYVVLKTYPDTSPGMRPGRVFSHALLLEAKYLAMLPNLRPLLAYLPDSINKTARLTSLSIPSSTTVNHPISLTPRLGRLLHCFVNISGSQPVLWADQQDFEDAICLIWQVMWPALRQQFRFGIGFSSRELRPAPLQLLAVPNVLLPQWQGQDAIVRATDAYTNLNEVEYYLIGDYQQASDLAFLLTVLKAEPSRFSDLNDIQAVAHTATRLSRSNLLDLLALASVVAWLQPNDAGAREYKQQLINRLLELVDGCSVEDLIALRTFSWQEAFGITLTKQLASATAERLATILRKQPDHELSMLLSRHQASTTAGWWSSSVETAMSHILLNWQAGLAPLVFDLWKINNSSAQQFLNLLPKRHEIEADLVNRLPGDLAKEVAAVGVQFASSRAWLLLHMACALKCWSQPKALSEQLLIDTKPDHLTALRYAQRTLPNQTFVTAAVELDEDRLIRLASELCAHKPGLLKAFKVEQLGWQRVWLMTLRQPSSLTGPDEQLIPRVWSLLDFLLEGGSVTPGLLNQLAQTTAVDLRNYPQRTDIWPHLAETKHAFLFATARSFLVNESSFELAGLELPLVETLQNSSFAAEYLALYTREIIPVLAYLTRVDISEAVVVRYLRSFRGVLSASQSQQLGRLIVDHKWKLVTDLVFELAKWNSMFYPALSECISLLDSVWSRFKALTMVGKSKKVVKDNDWWKALLDELRQVYPHGPTQDKIWQSAGGSEDIISTTKNGLEQWSDLLYRLRYNPPIALNDFLSVLTRENPLNDKIRTLYDVSVHDK